jgi:hypothetical protein
VPLAFFLLSVPVAFASTTVAVLLWFAGIPFQIFSVRWWRPTATSAEVRYNEQQDERGCRDDDPRDLAGDPTDGPHGALEVLRVEELEQAV